MRIVGIAMVSNEVDIIETFVRFNLQYLTQLIVIVDYPTDGTASVLQDLVNEGLPIELRAPRFEGFHPGGETTLIAKELFAAGQADFVLPLDADEFLHLPRPDYLHAALPALNGRFGCWRWRNFAPSGLSDSLPLFTNLSLQRLDEPEPVYKVVLTPGFLQSDYVVLRGHHCVVRQTEHGVQPLPMTELKSVRLAHMPIRSVGQTQRKLANAERAQSTAAQRLPGAGKHWEDLKSQMLSSDLITNPLLTLQRLALYYPFMSAAMPRVLPPYEVKPLSFDEQLAA
jgi:hypothetical protein